MRIGEKMVRDRSADWDALDAMLTSVRRVPLNGEAMSELARLYRDVCADLVRARTAGVPPDLVAHLDGLAARAHNRLYASSRMRPRRALHLLWTEFPRVLRKNARFFAVSAALFCIPFVLALAGTLFEPTVATKFVPKAQLQQSAQSYSQGFADGRDADADNYMAGFYVYNNVGIAFRCFATGILFGLGSVFFLAYNGLAIGAVLGFVTQAGYGRNIATFVCGHGAFELTAIVISGAAGLQMGWALIATGGRTRAGSLRAVGSDLVTLILGAGAMLVVAALIEGYWSPSGLPDPIKWTAALGLWILVGTWLAFAGRTPPEAHP